MWDYFRDKEKNRDVSVWENKVWFYLVCLYNVREILCQVH